MEANEMDFPLGTQEYSDGRCTHSSRIILDPKDRKVTHLIVKEKQQPKIEGRG
jgi:hypothetical protein